MTARGEARASRHGAPGAAAPGAAADALAFKRIAVVCERAATLLDIASPLLEWMTAHHHAVLALTDELERGGERALTRLEASARRVPFSRRAFAPIADFKTIGALTSELRMFAPDAVLCIGTKALTHGAIAAKRAGVARIVVLPTASPGDRSHAGPAAGWLPQRLWRLADARADAVLFLSSGHQKAIHGKGVLSIAAAGTVAPLPGLDLDRSPQRALPPLSSGLVFLMIAPPEPHAAVTAFARAARIVKAKAPGARFLLASPASADHSAPPPTVLQAASAGAIELLGPAIDAPTLIAQAHVLIVSSPTGYVQHTAHQALAAGRPLLVAEAAGISDLVDDRINGYLVPPNDAEALAGAIGAFLKRPDLIPAMARASRTIAEQRFDRRKVLPAALAALGLL